MLGLPCCMQTSSSCRKRKLVFLAVHGLLTAVASLVAEHRLWACEFPCLRHMGSAVVVPGLLGTGLGAVAQGLKYSMACGMVSDPGSDPCPLHWQVDL